MNIVFHLPIFFIKLLPPIYHFRSSDDMIRFIIQIVIYFGYFYCIKLIKIRIDISNALNDKLHLKTNNQIKRSKSRNNKL